MEERMKTVLVNVGENRRIVSFSSALGSKDVEALTKTIKETFGDILKSDQKFFILAKNEEWGGIFLDVLDQEIIDKAVVNVVLKPIQEVNSFCAMFSEKKNLLGILM